KYRDGTAIPNVIDNATWAALTTGARSYYNNDSTTNTPVYGVLYNWYAATDVHNLCPTSWHVPTHDEWTTLERAICTSGTCVTDFPYDITTAGYRGTDEGGKMKETGTIHWTSPNTGATNSSGFGALPGGSRYFNGTYDNVGSNGYWWSATAYDAVSAWLRILGYNYSQVYRYNSSKTYGFSVRCVRD
ncbi:MAG: fibrobacter succinogenes major paralogous domain-containing protein, partial [Bacteroidia bacterium]|nr:fibrobacter succinogenes major paralogous domain-containing protein [Bacteroidia bacterium]